MPASTSPPRSARPAAPSPSLPPVRLQEGKRSGKVDSATVRSVREELRNATELMVAASSRVEQVGGCGRVARWAGGVWVAAWGGVGGQECSAASQLLSALSPCFFCTKRLLPVASM